MSSDKCANYVCSASVCVCVCRGCVLCVCVCLPAKLSSLTSDFLHASQQVRRIQHDGYNVEQHTVITKDGYVLTLHRIPQVQLDANGTVASVLRRPVVFLLSGLYASSDV